jgi:sensor domain CHASE-containing protein
MGATAHVILRGSNNENPISLIYNIKEDYPIFHRKDLVVMSLRTRVILSITVSVLVFMGALYGVSQVLVIKGFEKLEQREANANVERVRNAMDEQFNFLVSKITDWAAWDDAFKFANDKNAEFVASTLIPDAPGNLNINNLIYVDNKGEFIGALGYDLDEGKPVPVDEFLKKLLVPGSYCLAPLFKRKL